MLPASQETVNTLLKKLSDNNRKEASKRINEGAKPEKVHLLQAAIETAQRVFSVMPKEDYLKYLRMWEEQNYTPQYLKRSPKPSYVNRPLKVIIIMLFNLAAFGQKMPFDTTKLQPTDPWLIRSFAIAHCSHYFDTTYCIPTLPTLIRSAAVSSVYEFNEFTNFKIFWTPWHYAHRMDKAWHVQSGACRGFSFSMPAPLPGVYTILFEHQTKPCVMQIAVTPKDLHEGEHLVELRFFQRCDPRIIFRTYMPYSAHFNMPASAPTTIEVFFKPYRNGEAFSIPDDLSGYTLIKKTETPNVAAFNYKLEKYGLYTFRYSNPHTPYLNEENLRCLPDKWELNSGTYHKSYYKK